MFNKHKLLKKKDKDKLDGIVNNKNYANKPRTSLL